MRSINVAVEGVASLLANLDPSKATYSGPHLDGIPARSLYIKMILFIYLNDLVPSLTLTYQAS